jgi:Ca2+-binding EF-hand superfamily protein
LLDVNGKGELGFEELRYINEQLRYGFSDTQLNDIIANVGGFGSTTITLDRWNKFIQRKVDKKRNLNI